MQENSDCPENSASGNSDKAARKDSAVSFTALVDNADLSELTRRLLSFQTPNEDFSVHPELSAQDCLTVCYMAIKHLSSSTSTCVQTDSPINIVGDLNGHFHDLLRFFDRLGQPPHTKYLFLGDYVNKGKFSVEVIVLLLSLMVMHPDSVLLLRGKHESASNCSHYGFRDELLGRFGPKSGKSVLVGFLRCFQWLPLAAIVGGKLFCCHGGISPSFQLEPFLSGQPETNFDLLNKINRPFELQQFGVACDLLCSDPMKSVARDNFEVSVPEGERSQLNWVSSRRGYSYLFSEEALSAALRTFNVSLLIRGNQILQEGFCSSLNRRCISLFSASGYFGTWTNFASVMQVESSEINVRKPGSFCILHPDKNLEKHRNHLWHTGEHTGAP